MSNDPVEVVDVSGEDGMGAFLDILVGLAGVVFSLIVALVVTPATWAVRKLIDRAQ